MCFLFARLGAVFLPQGKGHPISIHVCVCAGGNDLCVCVWGGGGGGGEGKFFVSKKMLIPSKVTRL